MIASAGAMRNTEVTETSPEDSGVPEGEYGGGHFHDHDHDLRRLPFGQDGTHTHRPRSVLQYPRNNTVTLTARYTCQ